MCDNFTYDDNDIISDTIINFYNSCDCKNDIKNFIDLYTSDKRFYEYIQKNFLINKISVSYLIRLFNDYDVDNVIDDYDYISRVTTTRWI